MKKDQKKLKLTKLTVANLDRLKGGIPPCACHWPDTEDGYWNQVLTGNPCPWTGFPGCEL